MKETFTPEFLSFLETMVPKDAKHPIYMVIPLQTESAKPKKKASSGKPRAKRKATLVDMIDEMANEGPERMVPKDLRAMEDK